MEQSWQLSRPTPTVSSSSAPTDIIQCKIVCDILNQQQPKDPFATWNAFYEDLGMWVVEKLDPMRCEAIHQTVLSAVQALLCSRRKWFDLCPSLANASPHIHLRTHEQWVQLFGPVVDKLLGGNPRNEIMPSQDPLLADLRTLHWKVQNATVPVLSETAGAFQPVKLSNARQPGIPVHVLLPILCTDVCSPALHQPWLANESISQGKALLYTYTLRVCAWDTALSRPSDLCRTLSQLHSTDCIFFGHRLSGLGVGRKPQCVTCLGRGGDHASSPGRGCCQRRSGGKENHRKSEGSHLPALVA